MKSLWIEEVYCREQEDYTGYDNVRIDITVDGTLVAVLRKNMSDSESGRRKWVIQKGYPYKDKAVMRVREEDDADADDTIADISVSKTTAAGVSKKNYKKSGNYDITFGVKEVADETMDAEWHVKAFEKSTKAGVWKNIAKPVLISDLRRLLANPAGTIKQEKAPYCGPASILYALSKRDDVKLVQMCRDLYETGQFHTANLVIKASEALRNSKLGFDMSPVNWLLQASIRDGMNATIDITSESGGVAGITMAGEMQELAKELLKLNLSHTTTYFYGEVDAIKQANKKFNEGGIAFLLVDASMMPPLDGKPRPQSTVYHPNHWVVFEGGLKIDAGVYDTFGTGNIRFRCWSWGHILDVVASEERFEDCLFGVVA